MAQMTVWTLEQRDPSRNVDKFYRAYALDNQAVFQWGRRHSRGQFKVNHHPSPGVARDAAVDKIYEKKRKGYTEIDQRTVTVPPQVTLAPARLANLYEADLRTTGRSWADDADEIAADEATAPPAMSADVIAFGEQVLRLLGKATKDPAGTATKFAMLRQEWTNIESAYEQAASYMETLELVVTGGQA